MIAQRFDEDESGQRNFSGLVDQQLDSAYCISIGKHVFVECWATYKHTSLTLIDWGEILALKLWSQNLTPVKI